MIFVIFLKLKHPSFGNICSPQDNLTCIVVAADSRCVCGCVCLGGGGWLAVHYELWATVWVGRFVRQAGATSESWKSLYKTLHNPFIHKCFGHMQSMVVLHDTRYSRVTLSVGPRGRRPSLWRTAGSEVNLTSKVESFLFVLWWYIVRVEEVGGD